MNCQKDYVSRNPTVGVALACVPTPFLAIPVADATVLSEAAPAHNRA
jgi:hypothetical protein